jgi:hypothetical protein
MNFELVRWGWPNAAAVLALAAIPFISVLLPAERPSTAHQVESIQVAEQHAAAPADVVAD